MDAYLVALLKTAGQFGPKKGDIEWVHYNEYIEYHIGDIE